MSELSKVKQEIIDIVEGEGAVTFCTSWMCRKLNQIRASRSEVALPEPIVDLVLQSMVDDGTLEHEGNDIYTTTSEPESETEPTVPPVVNIYNTFNITVNFISNNTDSSDNSVKIRKGK